MCVRACVYVCTLTHTHTLTHKRTYISIHTRTHTNSAPTYFFIFVPYEFLIFYDHMRTVLHLAALKWPFVFFGKKKVALKGTKSREQKGNKKVTVKGTEFNFQILCLLLWLFISFVTVFFCVYLSESKRERNARADYMVFKILVEDVPCMTEEGQVTSWFWHHLIHVFCHE